MSETQTIELTQEEIQRHYDAAMDSVNLINRGKPAGMSDVEWQDMVQRNVEHLKIMLGKDFWNGQDLTPLQTVVDNNSPPQ